METFLVTRDNARDLRFAGVRLASVSTSPSQEHPDYSGSKNRWRELSLYRTATDKFICQEIGHTNRPGEVQRNRAAICASTVEVVEFFGTDRLAKKLYEMANIDAAEDV